MFETTILSKDQREKELAKIEADKEWILSDLKSRLPEAMKCQPLKLDEVKAKCPELVQHCHTLAALEWYESYLEAAENFDIPSLAKN